MKKINMPTLLILATLCAGLYSEAQATDKSLAPTPLENVYKCTKLTNDSARLACYDEAVGVLKTKEDAKEFVAVDAARAKEMNRKSFGLNIPALPKLGLPDFGKKAAIKSITEPVQSVIARNRTHYITLKNGQVWEQYAGHISLVPKGDLTATIKSASLGSFKMTLSNGKHTVKNIKVRRIQ